VILVGFRLSRHALERLRSRSVVWRADSLDGSTRARGAARVRMLAISAIAMASHQNWK
jgi:hypothetical protein